MAGEIDYRQSGVNIEAGEAVVEKIKEAARSTFRPEVLQDLGGFGGLFALDTAQYRYPVLVSGCDSVGTKLKVAFAADKHDTVGEDCVAMCVNDILVQGAEPLFFLDYLAVGKLVPEQAAEVVSGVARGCRLAGCALIGGETAELPGLYSEGEYDLAGFAVGVVERDRIVDGSAITAGDVVIGMASTGLHSNGFSLARKVLLERAGFALDEIPPGLQVTLAEEMLRPTRIYVKAVLPLLQSFQVRGMAHITGGGMPGNLPRILPEGLTAEIREGSWPEPPVFGLIQERGPVLREEMYRTFNMGIGFVLVVPAEQAGSVVEELVASGLPSWRIGSIKHGAERFTLK